MSKQLVAYVESADEQLAFLVSRFGPQDTWSVVGQRLGIGSKGESVERATVRTAQGFVDVEFREGHPTEIITDESVVQDRDIRIEQVMERALAFAADNPPHHPGSLPRFPVPVEHYERAVAVPLPILAVDDAGHRGLFAPPRMAVVSWETSEPVGVRELDGFDPDSWPPARLGDWPTPAAAAMGAEVLEASIQRFGGCWSRVLDAWFSEDASTVAVKSLASDIDDALRLRSKLDLPAMDDVYVSINWRFARWVATNQP